MALFVTKVGGTEGMRMTELITAHRHSGVGSGYLMLSENKIHGENGDISANLINALPSQYFTASASGQYITLTAKQKCHVIKCVYTGGNNGVPTVTDITLNVNETIQLNATTPNQFAEALFVIA